MTTNSTTAVLTEVSTILCGPDLPTSGPPPTNVHGGTASVQSSAKLQVSGKLVLMESSIEQPNSIKGCKLVTTKTGTKNCDTVLSVTAGKAAKLTVGIQKQPVLL